MPRSRDSGGSDVTVEKNWVKIDPQKKFRGESRLKIPASRTKTGRRKCGRGSMSLLRLKSFGEK